MIVSKVMSIMAAALVMSASTIHAADLPAAKIDTSGWARMSPAAFGCLMEKTFGHRDARFNCNLMNYRNSGDPCENTKAYYEGPAFPKALVTRVHPLATDLAVSFEHGALQQFSMVLEGKFSDREVRKAFGLPGSNALPENSPIMSISVQDCGLKTTCLVVQGFDHQGAGDVDCKAIAPRRPN